MNHLKPYPAYKNSAVPWLGDVPKHWGIVPNRATFKELKESDHPEEEMLSVTITQGVIQQSSLLRDTSKKDSSNEDRSKYKLVCPGDIAYNKMRAWQGALGVSRHRGIVSPAYIIVRPRGEQHAKYYHYLLRTPAFAKEAERWSYGISSDQWSLRPEEFKQIYCCVPPLPEQTAIIRYIGYMDKRIRRYISNKKRLITLLNEQKQAIILQAVTGGIDPNVPLKSSGVEWLGDIPEHWEVIKIKRIARINPSRSDYDQSKDPEEMVVFLPMERVTAQGKVDCSEFRPIKEVRQGFSHFRRGDVVVAKITPCFENGKGAYLDTLPTDIGFGTTEFIVLRAGPKIEGEYLYLLTALAQFRLLGVESMTGSAGQQRISPNFVANFTVGLPPIHEQQEILKFISSRNADYNTAITRAQNEIDLLREYRTRLIADVVTGKLDVRGAAANLPEEVDEGVVEEAESSNDNGTAVEDDEEALTGVTNDD